MKTSKQIVIKAHPTAISKKPSPRGLYYDEWTVIIPATSAGVFGVMNQILGHGSTARKAWADAALTGGKGAGR